MTMISFLPRARALFGIMSVAVLAGFAIPAMAASDGFGDYFTASGPAALSGDAPMAMAATSVTPTAEDLNAITPAAGGDMAIDGAEAPATLNTVQGTIIPGTDTLASPEAAPVPGMDMTP